MSLTIASSKFCPEIAVEASVCNFLIYAIESFRVVWEKTTIARKKQLKKSSCLLYLGSKLRIK